MQMSLRTGYLSQRLSTICAILTPTSKACGPLQANSKLSDFTAPNSTAFQICLFSSICKRNEIPVSLSGLLPKNLSKKGKSELRLPSITILPLGAKSPEMTLQMLMKQSLCSQFKQEYGSSLIIFQSFLFSSLSCFSLSATCISRLICIFQLIFGTFPLRKIHLPSNLGLSICLSPISCSCSCMSWSADAYLLSSLAAYPGPQSQGDIMSSAWLSSFIASQTSATEMVSLLSARMNFAAVSRTSLVYISIRVRMAVSCQGSMAISIFRERTIWPIKLWLANNGMIISQVCTLNLHAYFTTGFGWIFIKNYANSDLQAIRLQVCYNASQCLESLGRFYDCLLQQVTKVIFIMLRGCDSSSEDEDENFQGQNFKKIDYDGAFDSDNLQSFNDESLSESQLKKMSKLKKSTSNKSLEQQDKSRTIKKNRQSAKMCRLRKKQYQQKLEQKVSQLQSQIMQRKANIKNASEHIFAKILHSNTDKYKYLQAKIARSKMILQIMKECKTARQPAARQTELEPPSEYLRNQQNSTLKEGVENTVEMGNAEANRTKLRKRRAQDRDEEPKNGFQQKPSQKESQLESYLKNYIYQFGMKGCLRNDVIQRSKYDWLQTLKHSKLQQSRQICNGVVRMKSCLQRLDNKSKLVDFHLRQLREMIKPSYALRFTLDRQCFAGQARSKMLGNLEN